MILLTFLLAIIILIIVTVIIGLGITGIAGIIVFGDVIVCIGLIVLLIKHLIKKFKK